MGRNSNKVNDLATASEALTATLGGSVTDSEKEGALRAFDHYGWTQSAGVRTVVKAFVQSVTVRDAVLDYLHSRAA